MTQKQANQGKKLPVEAYFEIYDTDNGYCFPWLDDSGENSGRIQAKPARFTRSDIERIFSIKFHLLSRLENLDRGVLVYCHWSDGYKRSLTTEDFDFSVKPKLSIRSPGGADRD
jgi:hypothetical protein